MPYIFYMYSRTHTITSQLFLIFHLVLILGFGSLICCAIQADLKITMQCLANLETQGHPPALDS